MKSIPTIQVEQIDTAKILKALATGKTLTYECTPQQRKAVQLVAHRQGDRLLTRAIEGGFSFKLFGKVKKRVEPAAS